MQYIGVDGCEAGWVTIGMDGGDDRLEADVFDSLEQLWLAHQGAGLVLLDMPIGLPDESTGKRLADAEAKRLLQTRSSTFFPTPCRAALGEAQFAAANAINRNITGKGLSKQAFNLLPKIREIDALLDQYPGAQAVIREAHPELCFRALSGRLPLKKKKDANGFLERMRMLEEDQFSAERMFMRLEVVFHKLDGVKLDDVLDAYVLALTAKLSMGTNLTSLPRIPQYDGKGRRMEIVFFEKGS